MRFRFHLFYLCILAALWCRFYSWQTDNTSGWWENAQSLTAVNLAQVMHTNEEWMEEIKKGYSDYPSSQSEKFYARSLGVMQGLKNAMNEIPALDEKQFWVYRTDYYQYLTNLVGNDQSAVIGIKNTFFPNKEDDKWAAQLFSARKTFVLEELKLRLALSSLSSHNYFLMRYHFCGGLVFDRFFPGMLLHSNGYVVGEKVDIPVVVMGFKSAPSSFQIISNGLPPSKEGILSIDTTIQTPGIHCFPFVIRYQNNKTDSLVELHDTILMKIFPR
jgi:hypothetical protein